MERVHAPRGRVLSLDIRLLTANILLELEQRQGKGNVVSQVLLSIEAELGLVALIALDVQTDGGSAAAGTRQTNDNAAAIVELDVQALVLGDTAVEVSVGEVTGINDLAGGDGRADEAVTVCDKIRQSGDDLVGTVAVDILIIIAREEGTAVGLPEIVLDRGNAGSLAGLLLGHTGNDVQPGNDGPETVLLTDMVAASTEALFTADGDLLVIEEVAEELPARGHLVALQTLRLGNTVDGTGGGHRTSQTVDALLLEPGDELGVVGNNRQAVTRRDESVGTVDHVTVTVTVARRTEVHAILIHRFHELMGIHEVGVRVATAKVLLGLAVHSTAGRQTELLDKDVHTIWTGHTVHTVEENLEILVGAEELLDEIKVEDLLHHCHVVGRGVDNLHLDGTVGLGANAGSVHIGDVNNVIGGQGLGGLVDLVGDRLGGRGTVGQVVLDTEVGVGTCSLVSLP